MAFKWIHAMSLAVTSLFLSASLFHLSYGQCQTDCQCVRNSMPPDSGEQCCLFIRENLPPGSPVGNANYLAVIANEMPAGYVFTPNNEQVRRLLNFSTETGAITTAAVIDREAISDPVDGDCIGFIVRPTGADGLALPIIGRFGVVIEDVNDNHPEFQPPTLSILNITVKENNAPGTLNCANEIVELINLQATDRDIGNNSVVTYKVAEGHGSDLFRVTNPQRPCVDNLVPMDRENKSISYSFVLVAMDGGDPQLSSNITVIFSLEDINDNAPIFLNATMNISVLENVPIGSVIHQFVATDLDLETEPLRYRLQPTMPFQSIPFQIDQKTGKLNLTRALGTSDTFVYMFMVMAIDSSELTSALNVTVTVIDVNEPAVVRTRVPPPAQLVEEEIGGVIFSILVVDNDKSETNTRNNIRFISGGEYFEVTDNAPIKIGSEQAFPIRQYAAIDRESVINDMIQLSVVIEQMGNPPLEDHFQHNFTILDINDNDPYLITSQFNITEDSDGQDQDTSTPRIQLMDFVRDDDEGMNGIVVSFSLISVRSINERDFTEDFRRSNALDGVSQEIHDGNLLLPRPLNRETFGGTLFVMMNFTDGGTPPRSIVHVFRIEIIDVNDHFPVFQPIAYTFNVFENTSSNLTIGSVKATDADDPSGNGKVVYLLDKSKDTDYRYFTVDEFDGTIRSNQALDRETKGRFVFNVSANDSGTPPRRTNASAKVTVIVMDINDEPPAFESDRFRFDVNNGANVGDFVGTVHATDPDEDPTENQISYKFQVPSPYFSIDNVTGNIVLTRVLSIQDSPYNVTVIACNPGFEHLKSTAFVSIVVVEPNVSIAIIAGVSGGAVLILLVAIFFLCCCIVCIRQKTKAGELEVDGNGAHLNNQKPILKTLQATNGQQRSVKFCTTVEETHYDPSGIGEHSVIRKESNIVSGEDSPQTSLRTPSLPNGSASTDSPEIVDYDMSPNLGINGDIPSQHHRPQYPRHDRIPSPIMLQEELNTSEFSQSTGSVIDDRNTYNSEGEEAESTYSDAPSNINTSIPSFGRKTVPVEEHHHPANFDRYAPPPTHPPLDIHHDLHSRLPPVRHIHGQHFSPGHLAELKPHNLAAFNAQYASSSHPPSVPPAEDIRDLSLGSLPRNVGRHRHHGSIGSSHTSTPPQRHIHRPPHPSSIRQPPPVAIPPNIIPPAPSNGHTNSRHYPHPLVMPEAFPSRLTSEVHRFDSYIPSFTDYGDTSTYASTELNEALEFKYEAEPDFCSLTATDYGENDTEL